jgi:hypothetical protein
VCLGRGRAGPGRGPAARGIRRAAPQSSRAHRLPRWRRRDHGGRPARQAPWGAGRRDRADRADRLRPAACRCDQWRDGRHQSRCHRHVVRRDPVRPTLALAVARGPRRNRAHDGTRPGGAGGQGRGHHPTGPAATLATHGPVPAAPDPWASRRHRCRRFRRQRTRWTGIRRRRRGARCRRRAAGPRDVQHRGEPHLRVPRLQQQQPHRAGQGVGGAHAGLRLGHRRGCRVRWRPWEAS